MGSGICRRRCWQNFLHFFNYIKVQSFNLKKSSFGRGKTIIFNSLQETEYLVKNLNGQKHKRLRCPFSWLLTIIWKMIRVFQYKTQEITKHQLTVSSSRKMSNRLLTMSGSAIFSANGCKMTRLRSSSKKKLHELWRKINALFIFSFFFNNQNSLKAYVEKLHGALCHTPFKKSTNLGKFSVF